MAKSGSGSSWSKAVERLDVVAVLVVTALSGGAVFYLATNEIGHVHPGSGTVPLIDKLILPLDTLGVVLTLLVALQLMSGSRAIRFRTSFRPAHIVGGWAILALAAGHGLGTTIHALTPPTSQLLMLTVVMGLTLLALSIALPLSGYWLQGRKRVRLVHAASAIALGVIVAAHGVMGVLHTFTG